MRIRLAFALALALAASATAWAQSYPSRPITLVVPFGAGGPADAIGRIATRINEPPPEDVGTPGGCFGRVSST